MIRLFAVALAVLVLAAAILIAVLALNSGDDEDDGPETTNVQLFFYDPERDRSPSGNIECSEKGLVGVARDIELDPANLEETIRLLLQGELTGEEREQGLTSEFPLSGLALESAELSSGRLTLTFDDPQSSASGGACRVQVLRAQVEATARQFPGVAEVVIEPDEIFQP